MADEACELASRVVEGSFYVARVGQFKRGKSTLINALIGREMLPIGFLPLTAVPTVIRFGEYARARVPLETVPGATYPFLTSPEDQGRGSASRSHGTGSAWNSWIVRYQPWRNEPATPVAINRESVSDS